MLLISCPNCGPRDETEFHYGGQAHVPYPENPNELTDREWAEYLFYRDNTKGAFAERWLHSTGCRQWFNMLRDTVTYDIQAVYPMGAPGRTSRPGAESGTASTAADSTTTGTAAPSIARHQHSPHQHHRPGRSNQVTSQNARLDAGGRIDRTISWRFTVDGEEFTGHPGDTLASALLANGRIAAGNSLYEDRPRGIMSAGVEESNALVQGRAPVPGPRGRVHAPRHHRHPGGRPEGRTAQRPGQAGSGRGPRRVRQEVRPHRRPGDRRRPGRPGRGPRGRAHRRPGHPDGRPARTGRLAAVRVHGSRPGRDHRRQARPGMGGGR